MTFETVSDSGPDICKLDSIEDYGTVITCLGFVATKAKGSALKTELNRMIKEALAHSRVTDSRLKTRSISQSSDSILWSVVLDNTDTLIEMAKSGFRRDDAESVVPVLSYKGDETKLIISCLQYYASYWVHRNCTRSQDFGILRSVVEGLDRCAEDELFNLIGLDDDASCEFALAVMREEYKQELGLPSLNDAS